MRSTVLARPNLKLFLLMAVLIAALHDLVSNGRTEASVFRDSNPRIVAFVTETELDALLKEAERRPSAAVYARISEAYEKRGDLRKAVHFMRRADLYVQLEEEE
jgi:hypothetical protein